MGSYNSRCRAGIEQIAVFLGLAPEASDAGMPLNLTCRVFHGLGVLISKLSTLNVHGGLNFLELKRLGNMI